MVNSQRSKRSHYGVLAATRLLEETVSRDYATCVALLPARGDGRSPPRLVQAPGDQLSRASNQLSMMHSTGEGPLQQTCGPSPIAARHATARTFSCCVETAAPSRMPG